MKGAEPAGGGLGTSSQRSRARLTSLAQARTPEVLEREVLRLSGRIDALEREREQLEVFLGMAAHEMLKPLVMNETYAALIRERMGHTLDLDSRRDVDAMIRISSRVRLLVEALLTDASDGHRPLHREHLDLSNLIGDCVRMLETEIKTREAHVEVDPMPIVEGNPALLSGVISNLLINALKYGPRTGARIHISAEQSAAGWTFAVQSSGNAIPEHGRERIFEAWQRGPGERRTRGAGLGLAIVRHIVERHGGQVGVTSPNGSSNRFFFTLPA